MVTCGGQATIPIVAAIARGRPGALRRDRRIDRVAVGRARARAPTSTSSPRRPRPRIEQVGGAARGKAIIVLNPADPPMIMRDTVLGDRRPARRRGARGGSTAAVAAEVAAVAEYVPGYRLKQQRAVRSTRARSSTGSCPRTARTRRVHAGDRVPRGGGRGHVPARVRREPRHHDLRRMRTAEALAGARVKETVA